MINDQLQRWLDDLRRTAPQRWALGSISVLSVIVALATMTTGSQETFGWFAWFVIATSVVATVQGGSHTALLTIGLLAVEWLAAVDDVTTPRSLVVAACLLVFHSVLALMAVTPHTAPVDAEVLRRWVRRSGLVMAATLGVWWLAWTFEQRDAPANPLLTLFALVTLGVAAVALRRRSVAEPDI